MTHFIEWMENHQGAWENTKEFKSKRKFDWKIIETALGNCGIDIPKKYYKIHKQYFMNGCLSKTVDGSEMDDDYMRTAFNRSGGTMFFMMWYHPENNIEVFRSLFDISASSGCIESAKANLWSNQVTGNIDILPKEYGSLGGKQENIFRALYPSLDFNETKQLHLGESSIHMGPSLGTVLRFVNPSCNNILLGNERYFNSAGQFLWDYLDFSINITNNDEIEERMNFSKSFYDILYRSKYQGATLGFAKNNPHSVKLANEIKHLFENKKLCQNLQDIWNNIDMLYEKSGAAKRYC